MAVSMETQRLISVSLGKIAQSRGQRGGINLHKNLLVATVLHKARNAYMMESYTYQQTLQRQKLLEQYQLQQENLPCQKIEASAVGESNKGETCPISRDSNLGHPAATPTGGDQSRSNVSSDIVNVSIAPEPMSVQDSEIVVNDKENSPPSNEDRHALPENITVSDTKSKVSQDSHLTSATQLSHDAQLSSSDHSWKHQTSTTSGGTTCNVLKRRRENPSASSHDSESPVSKIARVQTDSSVSPVTYTSYSSDNSDEQSRSESHNSRNLDSHQILNLVNIFNSGFSGLCVNSSSDLPASCCQSELDISSLQSHTRKIATKAG